MFTIKSVIQSPVLITVFLRGGGDYSLVSVGFCGAVSIGYAENLELWLQFKYHVIAILVPVTKSELIEESVWLEVLIFGREMDAMR